LNPTSLACAIAINVPNFPFEEKKCNMFGVGTSMEEFSCALIVRFIYLFRRLSILASACVDPLSWWRCHGN
jgi:hypothetical protein